MSKLFKILKKTFFLALSLLMVTADFEAAQVNEFAGFLKVDGVSYEQPLSVLGSATLSHVKAQELKLCGPLEANDLKILGNLTVLGPVKAEDLKADEASITGPLVGTQMEFRTLQVTGFIDVARLTVQGSTQIIGSANIRQAHLQKLEVVSEEIILEDVEVAQIHFKKSDKPQDQPKLILKGNTIVHQGICFDSGNGQVSVVGSQVSIKGTVEGALPFGASSK